MRGSQIIKKTTKYNIHPPNDIIKSGKFKVSEKNPKKIPVIAGIKPKRKPNPNQIEYLISSWHWSFPFMEQPLHSETSFHIQIL